MEDLALLSGVSVRFFFFLKLPGSGLFTDQICSSHVHLVVNHISQVAGSLAMWLVAENSL